MIIQFDKTLDPNIVGIDHVGVECDRAYWNSISNPAVSINNTTTFTMVSGADGLIVTFANKDAMTPYIQQFERLFISSKFVTPTI